MPATTRTERPSTGLRASETAGAACVARRHKSTISASTPGMTRRSHGRSGAAGTRRRADPVNQRLHLFQRITMFKHRFAAAALALGIALVPARGKGQQPTVRSPQRVVATVAIVDSLPVPGVPFVVRRRPDRRPIDLILLRANATPADLSDAVRTLLTARQSGGDYPMMPATVRMRPHQTSAVARRDFPWAQQLLDRLRKAKPRPVDGAGTVRAVAL
jgi:hypothetical protein